MQLVHSVEAMPEGVDSLVILGKQFGIGSSFDDVRRSPDFLSDDSRINVIAGGMLWQPGRRILLSGNKKALFPDAASEYLAENFPHIPPESYANPDDESPDTLASTENVPSILNAEGYNTAALVTGGFHIKRAVAMFDRKSDIITRAAVAEDIRAERSPEDEDYIIAWQGLTRVKLERVKEFALRRVDSRGNLGKAALRAIRP
jgi:hypothetical protein